MKCLISMERLRIIIKKRFGLKPNQAMLMSTNTNLKYKTSSSESIHKRKLIPIAKSEHL